MNYELLKLIFVRVGKERIDKSKRECRGMVVTFPEMSVDEKIKK